MAASRAYSAVLFTGFIGSAVWAADISHTTPGPGKGADAMMANSPFSVYTAGAVGYVLIVMVIVVALFTGAYLAVNLALMTRRPKDKNLGEWEPSDLGVLQGERGQRNTHQPELLPAEENEDQPVEHFPEHRYDRRRMLSEREMRPDWQPGAGPRDEAKDREPRVNRRAS